MIILTDLDHTLSDATWRDHMIGDWDAYYAAGERDQPIWPMVEMVRYMSYSPLWEVIGLTTRPRRWEGQTRAWLKRHHVNVGELLMRPEGDHTPSADLKVRLIKERFLPNLSRIRLVIEDRPDAVAAIKSLGLRVLQLHTPPAAPQLLTTGG